MTNELAPDAFPPSSSIQSVDLHSVTSVQRSEKPVALSRW